MEKKDELIKIFSKNIREILNRVAVDFDEVQEIRLRAGQSMLFTVNGRVSPAAKYLPRADRLRRLTAKEVQDCFQHLCRD